MSDHLDKLFPKWFKGELSEAERERLHDHLEECEECRAEFDRVREDFALLAGRGNTSAPSDDLRDRILDDLEPEARFVDLLDQIADLLDVSNEQARQLLRSAEEEGNWVPVPGYDISFLYFPFVDFEPGEGVDEEFASILRVESGAEFPEHRHMGRERVFVLQGTLVEEDGRRFGRGETVEHDHDTAHTFHVPEDSPPLIGLVLVEQGFEIGGVPFGGPET